MAHVSDVDVEAGTVTISSSVLQAETNAVIDHAAGIGAWLPEIVPDENVPAGLVYLLDKDSCWQLPPIVDLARLAEAIFGLGALCAHDDCREAVIYHPAAGAICIEEGVLRELPTVRPAQRHIPIQVSCLAVYGYVSLDRSADAVPGVIHPLDLSPPDRSGPIPPK